MISAKDGDREGSLRTKGVEINAISASITRG